LGTFRSDQGAIWNGVSMLASNLKAESPGMAMSEIYRKNAPSIGKYVGHFGLADVTCPPKTDPDFKLEL
jgi:hypothetical protein